MGFNFVVVEPKFKVFMCEHNPSFYKFTTGISGP